MKIWTVAVLSQYYNHLYFLNTVKTVLSTNTVFPNKKSHQAPPDLQEHRIVCIARTITITNKTFNCPVPDMGDRANTLGGF